MLLTTAMSLASGEGRYSDTDIQHSLVCKLCRLSLVKLRKRKGISL